MKKILIILSFFAMITSCGKLEDLNVNTKDPVAVPGETLFTGAQRRVMNEMASSNVNLNNFRLFTQQWTETTYTDESNYDLTTRTTPDNLWDIMYLNCLKNFNEAAKVMEATPAGADDPAVKQNKLAINDVLQVYCYDVLVTAFGDVPYSQALDIDKNPLPKYDDALTVYKALLTRLSTDITNMNASFGSFGAADNMFGGDVGMWLKFSNSLKLRMALVLADADDATAKAAAEEAAPGVIASNADNAKIIYSSVPPNTNPIYIDLIASGRHDFVPANTLVDSMNSLQDPRRAFFFTQIDTSSEAGVVKMAYVGGVYGASNDFTKYSHVADLIQTPTFPGTLFDYAEVEFLLAEAVSRNYSVGGTAEDHYNKAIAASIEDWGGTALDAAAYLANPRVAWATAHGDWKEKIGMQSWFAYYNRGYESWTQWRKLDFPLLAPPPDALSAIPLRYTYPIEEQTLNPANWKSASTAVGGDAVTTKLFFDKLPNK
jgi:hypothetical protein